MDIIAAIISTGMFRKIDGTPAFVPAFNSPVVFSSYSARSAKITAGNKYFLILIQ